MVGNVRWPMNTTVVVSGSARAAQVMSPGSCPVMSAPVTNCTRRAVRRRVSGMPAAAAAAIAAAIKAVAKEMGVACVDFYSAFGDGVEFLNPDDGLHLSDAGGEKIASGFASKL